MSSQPDSNKPIFKNFHKKITTPKGRVVICGPVLPEELEGLVLDDGLRAFRPPERQHKALVEIAKMDGGQIFAAVFERTIVAYLSFHPPDKFERWGQANIPELIELGGMETSPDWRGLKISSTLLKAAFAEGRFAENIVIATEYCWHWDLKGTGLPVYKYRQMMEKLLGQVGLYPLGTDDPEVCSHPANMFSVRVGSKVSSDAFIAFEAIRYLNKNII